MILPIVLGFCLHFIHEEQVFERIRRLSKLTQYSRARTQVMSMTKIVTLNHNAIVPPAAVPALQILSKLFSSFLERELAKKIVQMNASTIPWFFLPWLSLSQCISIPLLIINSSLFLKIKIPNLCPSTQVFYPIPSTLTLKDSYIMNFESTGMRFFVFPVFYLHIFSLYPSILFPNFMSVSFFLLNVSLFTCPLLFLSKSCSFICFLSILYFYFISIISSPSAYKYV